MAGSSGAPTGNAAETIAWLKQGGHYDELRHKMMDQIRSNSKLREETEAAIEKSQTLRGCATLVLDNTAKKEVYVQLRKELDKELREKVETHAWALISDRQGELYQLLEAKVHEALCVVYESKHQQVAESFHENGGGPGG